MRTLSYVFLPLSFLDPSPVRRVPIQTGIQRELNFVSARTIKGRSSDITPQRRACEYSSQLPKSLEYCVCVFITAGPMIKLFAGGGGGEWRTCAMQAEACVDESAHHAYWLRLFLVYCNTKDNPLQTWLLKKIKGLFQMGGVLFIFAVFEA